jgi:hypothetical protein
VPNPIYVRSTDGSDSDDGSTWALAKASLAGAAAIDSTTDNVIYVSQAHAESQSADISLAWAGTKASPTYVVCVNDGAAPPTAVAATGSVLTTGNIALNNTSNYAYFSGLIFTAGSGQSLTRALRTGISQSVTVVEGCKLRLATTGNGQIETASSTNSVTKWLNTTLRFASTGQSIQIPAAGCDLLWSGGGIESGGSIPNTLFTTLSASSDLLVEGCDFTLLNGSQTLFSSASQNIRAVLRNVKFGASWTGALHNSTPGANSRFALYNYTVGSNKFGMLIAAHYGTLQSETTIVRTGGASDGDAGLSWKMVSNADAEYPYATLNTDEIVRWNETTGSSVTVTVEVITDNVTLTDAQCWLEVQYLSETGTLLGAFGSDAKADILATAANQTTSSETWTTTGLTTPVKQKLSVSFTPQQKGFIHATVKLARASTTVYVCPKLEVT